MTRRSLLCRLGLLAAALMLAGCPTSTTPEKDDKPPTASDKPGTKDDSKDKPGTTGDKPVKPPPHDPGR
jgi:hypothetical protein